MVYRGYKIKTEIYGAWNKAACKEVESYYSSKNMKFSVGLVKLDIDRAVERERLVEKYNMSGEWLGVK